MLRIICDTDMGVDCDDAVAFAILLNKHIAGEIDIACVTASSTREGATATIKVISDYYGVNLPIGAMAPPALACDQINNYAKAVKDFYDMEDTQTDAVTLMRKSLAQTKEKCTLIVLGPMCNMERLLKSKADENSPLDGEGLFREKVAEVYCMGGSFKQNRLWLERDKQLLAEWNILQDVSSAQYFVGHCPVGITFVPWESGAHVMTIMGSGDNPVWYCMLQYAISEKLPYEPNYERMSWDPVTCLCATEDCSEYFNFSAAGRVTVEGNGYTKFAAEEGGKHRILLLKDGYQKIAEKINSFIEPVKSAMTRKRE